MNDHKNSGVGSETVARLGRFAASPWSAGTAIALVLVSVLLVSLQRTHFFNLGAENDFTGAFGLDAVRILAGEPVRLPFHPPGYPFAAALARTLSGSWLAGGLWVSGLSALVVLVVGFMTFRRLFGVAASWGVLIASVCSTVFLAFASTVTSDMLFAALVTVMLALVVGAMLEPNRAGLWLCSGLLSACVVLTRANGLAAAAALIAPLLLSASLGNRLRRLGLMALGLAVPLLLWALYATVTESQLAPSGNYLNLAVAAFGDESKSWAEQSPHFAAQFTGLVDVLTHDPARMAAHFAQRMLLLPARLALELTWPVLAVLALPGVIWALLKQRTPAFLAYLLVACALAMFTAIAEFRPRYFLFLLPLVGAMAALGFSRGLEKFVRKDAYRAAATGLAACIVVVVAARPHAPLKSKLESKLDSSVLPETGEAIPFVRRLTEPDATIVARKSNLAFEAGRTPWQMPDVPNLDELLTEMCAKIAPGKPVYLFNGLAELQDRPALASEISAARHVPWLQLIAKGDRTAWSLYLVQLDGPAAAGNGNCATRHGEDDLDD